MARLLDSDGDGILDTDEPDDIAPNIGIASAVTFLITFLWSLGILRSLGL